MHTTDNFYFHLFQPHFRMGIAFIIAVALNTYAIPVIIRIARAKKLFDIPDERKKHIVSTPTLGGIGFYATIMSVSLTMINTCGMNGIGITSSLPSLPPIMAGFTIIFFIGMKDDLLSISAGKRLFIEIIALLVLIVIGDLRLTSLQGMFNVTTLSYTVSVLLSLFVGLVIINACNLIDGIDGLAASVSMLGSIVFGICFFVSQEWEYAVLATVIFGSLVPYFLFNVYGVNNKIFMGDTGSLILGFAMTVFVFKFNQMTTSGSMNLIFSAAPAFSFAVLILPLFDTLRVFTLRLLRGESPFKADRGHVHHIFLDLGFNHIQTTLILILINIAFISFAYFFNRLGNLTLFLSMLIASIVLSSFATKFHRRKTLNI